jgi:AraC-like DNA-binding protein/quercetin dioxygenase-like cupin family protein
MSVDRYEARLTDNLARVEGANALVVALSDEFPAGYSVRPHQHSRAQLLYPATGVVSVATDTGRWLVPPEHALWIPANTVHWVDMLGDVAMRSVYVSPDTVPRHAERIRVLGLTALMRSLIMEAGRVGPESGVRGDLVMALLVEEIPNLPELPLGLPLPADPRLAALCRTFVASPDPHQTIDVWAGQLAMSRRAFTRAFRRETGVSLSIWRQQACLFAALPRLAHGEPVTSVALDLGYDSVAAFTTMFKRMLGAPPKSYLRLSDTKA